jgi:hypothetical protein
VRSPEVELDIRRRQTTDSGSGSPETPEGPDGLLGGQWYGTDCFSTKAAKLKFLFFTYRWVKSGSFTRTKVSILINWLEPPIAEEFDEECPLYGIGIDEDEEIEVPLEVIELNKNHPNYRLISD